MVGMKSSGRTVKNYQGRFMKQLGKERQVSLMKKKVLSILLALIMCLSLTMSVNPVPVLADEVSAELTTSQTFSPWATYDLIVGDTYGIYPLSWYEQDMTAPITRSQFKVLMSGVRRKLVSTDEVVKNVDKIYKLEKNMTVDKVLDSFSAMLAGFEFSDGLAFTEATAKAYMKESGVYTGTNGELALTDTCSVEQACVIGTRLVTTIFEKLNASSKGFLWVTKSGGNTVYLLGSIHLASTDIYPFSSEMLKAFYSSDALAVELNMFDTAGAMKIQELGVYTDGTTLKDHVSADTYKKTVEFAAMYGISEEVISICKPWYIYISFAALSSTDSANMQEAATAASLGIDMNFMTNALITGKPIVEIEGYEYQAKVLDSFSDDLEELLLTSTINSINDILAGTSTNSDADNIDIMLELWKKGDVETFKKYNTLDDEYPEILNEEAAAEKALMDEFTLKLLTQRDAHMAEFINGLLKAEGNHTYFVVVGSAHYISDHSVIDRLEEKGYEVTQIK